MRSIAVVTIIAAAVVTTPVNAKSRIETKFAKLKTCLDVNLKDLLPSGDNAETLNKAIRAICGDIIDGIIDTAILEAIEEENDKPNSRDIREGKAWLTKKFDGLIYAYTVKFKAVGGPTTLNVPDDD